MKLLLVFLAVVVCIVSAQTPTPVTTSFADISGQWNNIGGPHNVGGIFNICLSTALPSASNIQGGSGFFATWGVVNGYYNSTSRILKGDFYTAGINSANSTLLFNFNARGTFAIQADPTFFFFYGWYSFDNQASVQTSWNGTRVSAGISPDVQGCFGQLTPATGYNLSGSFVDNVPNFNYQSGSSPSFDACITPVQNNSAYVLQYTASYDDNGGGYIFAVVGPQDLLQGYWADGSGAGYIIGRLYQPSQVVLYRTSSPSPQNNNLRTVAARNTNTTIPIPPLTRCNRNYYRGGQFFRPGPSVSNLVTPAPSNSVGSLVPSFVLFALLCLAAFF